MVVMMTLHDTVAISPVWYGSNPPPPPHAFCRLAENFITPGNAISMQLM